MRFHKLGALGCAIVICCAVAASAQTAPAQTKDTAAIEQVLHDQEAAWNRGDIETFMRGYKDSPETTFIGKTISHGYQPILERYKKGYASREAMGTLDFSELTVRMLGSDYAVVTGRYHLARTAEGGGEARGIFSLIFERESRGEHEADGWKIILDHTS
jgi:uncharacterized protein (TIGR02246 family)